jgi:hypothetical protein
MHPPWQLMDLGSFTDRVVRNQRNNKSPSSDEKRFGAWRSLFQIHAGGLVAQLSKKLFPFV